MKRGTSWLVLLSMLGLGVVFTSVVLAAPAQPAAPATWAQLLSSPTPVITPTAVITPTPPVSPTGHITHPVAWALAQFFNVPYGEILSLHQEGLGFGVIAKAYFATQTLQTRDGSSLTARDLIDAFQSGQGWGQVMKAYNLHPGRAGRGGSLGDVNKGGKDNSGKGKLETKPGKKPKK